MNTVELARLVEGAVEDALRDLEGLLPPGTTIPSGEDTPLLEEGGGPLDSLGVVNLMVAVEEAVERATGRSISLMEWLGLGAEEGPFRSRRTLLAGVMELLHSDGPGA